MEILLKTLLIAQIKEIIYKHGEDTDYCGNSCEPLIFSSPTVDMFGNRYSNCEYGIKEININKHYSLSDAGIPHKQIKYEDCTIEQLHNLLKQLMERVYNYK